MVAQGSSVAGLALRAIPVALVEGSLGPFEQARSFPPGTRRGWGATDASPRPPVGTTGRKFAGGSRSARWPVRHGRWHWRHHRCHSFLRAPVAEEPSGAPDRSSRLAHQLAGAGAESRRPEPTTGARPRSPARPRASHVRPACATAFLRLRRLPGSATPRPPLRAAAEAASAAQFRRAGFAARKRKFGALGPLGPGIERALHELSQDRLARGTTAANGARAAHQNPRVGKRLRSAWPAHAPPLHQARPAPRS